MLDSKERFIRPSDIDKAEIDFLENGTVLNKLLGEVIWDDLRAREFIRRTPEEVTAHNAMVSERRSSRVIFQGPRLLERLKRGVAGTALSPTHR